MNTPGSLPPYLRDSISKADTFQHKVLEQTACPSCSSSDAFTIYDKGDKKDGYCFSCSYFSKDPDKDLNRSTSESTPYDHVQYGTSHHSGSRMKTPSLDEVKSLNSPSLKNLGGGIATSQIGDVGNKDFDGRVPKIGIEDGLLHPIRSIPHRGLSHATCEHFNVRIGVSTTDGETPIYTLFPQHHNSELTGWLCKTRDKGFSASGGTELDLFGSNLIPAKGKKLWITTGLEDAMSIYQVLKETSSYQDWEPPVLALPSGDRSAVASLTRQLDLVNGYDEIILCFDNDASGIKAREEVCKMLAGKVYYVTFPRGSKDANDMLVKGKGNELKWLVLTGQKKYQPDGIVNAKDLWERYSENKEEDEYYPYPEFLPELNLKTYGCRPGSIVTITSGTGMGKSQFLKELIYHFYLKTDQKISGMFLEEDVIETIESLISLDLNKRISLPDVSTQEEEERYAFEKLFGSGRISLYDFFGGMDDGSLLAKLRYFAVTGHKFIFLDHLSIVVSEYAAEGGERERIDTLMTKLAKFVKEFNVILFLVVHLRKSDNTQGSFEEGRRPSLDDLRGSGSLKQLSWDVIALARNQQHWDPACARTTEVSVLKCRKTGRTGVAGYMQFDDNTGRLLGVQKPLNFSKKKPSKEDEDSEF